MVGVKKALQRYQFDLIQSNERTLSQHIYRAGDGVHATWLTLRKARSSPVKRLSLALNPFHRYMLRLEKKMFEAPELRAIIVNSEMVRREITDRFQVDNLKIHTIYNGVDCSRFHPDNKRNMGLALRQRQGISPEAKIALLVGSGYERKGVRPLLAALARVPENILLWVVGKDSIAPYRKLARQLGIAERVTFWGKQQDVRPFYAAADFFVLPTLYDPFPSVALEAMASGLPDRRQPPVRRRRDYRTGTARVHPRLPGGPAVNRISADLIPAERRHGRGRTTRRRAVSQRTDYQ